MIVYARHNFQLDKPGKDGHSTRTHLTAAWKRSGRKPQALEGPAYPALGYVLRWFNELSDRRGGNGFGPTPISWGDIESWSRLTGAQPDPFEAECIAALDREFLAVFTKTKE